MLRLLKGDVFSFKITVLNVKITDNSCGKSLINTVKPRITDTEGLY